MPGGPIDCSIGELAIRPDGYLTKWVRPNELDQMGLAQMAINNKPLVLHNS